MKRFERNFGFYGFISIFLMLFPLSTGWSALREHPPPFPSTPRYQPYVEFWIRVFSIYHGNQVIVHDAREPWNIFKIITFKDFPPEREKIPEKYKDFLKRQRETIENVFMELHREGPKAATRSQLHRWLWSLYGKRLSEEPDIFKAVANRIRFQWGMREIFMVSLKRMHRYQNSVKKIIQHYKAPEDLIYLPLLESGYNPYAGSFAGARGLWQFMRTAGQKHGLIIGQYLDQRYDPELSTGAAMRYLLDAYRRFGSWPLALTSYNHGVNGIERALKQMGNRDWDEILINYDGPAFGFASRNFYAEFLAVRYLAKHRQVYFPDLTFDDVKEWTFQEVVLNRTLPIRRIPSKFNLPVNVFIQYNPQFLLRAFMRNVRIRKGTRLRLPSDRLLVHDRDYHIIRPGETLRSIAEVYGLHMNQLRQWNPDLHPSRLIPGQKLRVKPPQTTGPVIGR